MFERSISVCRACKIYYIPEYVKTRDMKPKIKEAEKEVALTSKLLTENIRKCNEDKAKLSAKGEQALEEVRLLRQKLNAIVDDLTRKTEQQLEFQYENLENTLEEDHSQVEPLEDKLTECVTELKSAIASGAPPTDPRVEEFGAKMNAIRAEVERLERQPRVALVFEPSRAILDLFETGSTLGRIDASSGYRQACRDGDKGSDDTDSEDKEDSEIHTKDNGKFRRKKRIGAGEEMDRLRPDQQLLGVFQLTTQLGTLSTQVEAENASTEGTNNGNENEIGAGSVLENKEQGNEEEDSNGKVNEGAEIKNNSIENEATEKIENGANDDEYDGLGVDEQYTGIDDVD